MNKQISIIVVLLVILVGAYWLSTGNFGDYNLRQNTDDSNVEGNITVTTHGPIGVAKNSSIEYLVDKDNLTLYVNLLDEDPAGNIQASCDTECENTWLPYLLPEDEATIDKNSDSVLSKINLFTRNDGQIQYTLGTQPLYRYSGDNGPGDTKGDGVDSWMIAKP